MVERRGPGGAHETSTGHAASEAGWLDAHFEACRPEYEAMLRSVGLEPGWLVLDAGCGSGLFLPLIGELVGPTGGIAALDLAPENVDAVARRVAAWNLACPVDTHVGGVQSLPFQDASFDAVWCANVTQYLSDDELATALAEMRRVVRPGGLVAIKEYEGGHTVFAPADPAIWWHFMEAGIRSFVQGRGQVRARELHAWLARAGLREVRQRTTLTERTPPLRPAERQYCAEFFATCARISESMALPEADVDFWRGQRDAASPGHIVNRPDFYFCEGAVVAVGRVPDERSEA